MNLGKIFFGVDPAHLAREERPVVERQIFIYNILSFMLLTLVGLGFVAGLMYGLIIFGGWLLATLVGLFFAAISFILLLLVLFLNMTTNHRSLYENMTHMEPVFDRYRARCTAEMTDEKAIELTEQYREEASASSIEPDPDPFHISKLVTSSIKVILILILSIVVANGIELLLFKGSINQSLETIRNSDYLQRSVTQMQMDTSDLYNNERGSLAAWTQEVLTERKEVPFHIIHSYSLILAIETMQMTMGKWKLVMDLLFALLFLFPFILVRKSREFCGGAFLKDVALSNISISLLFFFFAQRRSLLYKKRIKEKYDHELSKIPEFDA